MHRLLHLLLFILFLQTANAQQKVPLTGSKYIGVSVLVFDDEDNRYIIGRYKGDPTFLGLPESSNMRGYIAKLDPTNNLIWAKSINEKRQRYNLHLENKRLYVLARTQESDYDKGIKISTAYLEQFDISNGNMLSDNQIAKMEGKGAFIDGKFKKGALLLFAKASGDSEHTLNSQKVLKSKYSAIVFQQYDLSGTFQWEHKIEGGFNGFTDIRIGDVGFDNEGNAYVVSFFGESLELGNASYTTDVHFEHKTLPLYFQGSFLMRINKDGTPGPSVELAKFDIDFEKIVCDKDQMYILGYYKGNKEYAAKLEGNNTPVEFLGTTLIDSPLNPGTNSPSENLLIACVDYSYNLKWHRVANGSGNSRSRSMCISGDNIYIAGTSSSNIEIEGHSIDGFGTDGYSDAFILKLTKDGDVVNSQAFHGPGSVTSKIFGSTNGSLVSTIYFNKEHVIINGEKVQRFTASASEMIYDLTGEKSSTTNTTKAGFKVGDRVQGNWKAQGRYYPGTIGKVEGDKYYIQYDDGDVEWTTAKYIKKL